MNYPTGHGKSSSNTGRVTLGEGKTPLISSQQIGRELGLKSLFFKLENCIPRAPTKIGLALPRLNSCCDRVGAPVLQHRPATLGHPLPHSAPVMA